MASQDQPNQSAEDALRESEYRYRNLFQAMAASFWELDFSPSAAMLRQLRAEGVKDYSRYFSEHPEFVRDMMRVTRVLDVNDQTVSLFGRSDKSELLQALDVYWPEESNHIFAASVLAAVTGNPSYAAECKLRKLDGETFDALFTACFALGNRRRRQAADRRGRYFRAVRAQKMLAQVQAEFAHAARVSTLGELTASIAHEINQPLAAIATNASAGLRWLDRPEPDVAEVRALTQRIIADAQRAAEIIARVRGMAGHRTPEPFRRLLSTASWRRRCCFSRMNCKGAAVTLTLALAKDLPPLLGDRAQVQQVIVNLAINAAQAMSQTSARETPHCAHQRA